MSEYVGPVWCCNKKHDCKWPSFKSHRGLGWGTIPNEHNVWRQWHDRKCDGKLIQLIPPNGEGDE